MTAVAAGVDDKLSTSGGTMSGNLSLQGAPFPLTIPAGAGAGMVLTSDSSGNASWQQPGTGLAATAVQTSAYTAAHNNFVPVDATSASVTITLPTAPANGTAVGVKLIATASGHTTSIITGPGDAFNKTGGATTETLSLLNQGMTLMYASGIWYVLSDDLALSQLDARYSNTAATMINVQNAAYGAKGDGATDDTTAIQNALNAAGAGDTVYVPYTSAGYLCGALTIPPGITFQFDGGAKLTAPASLSTSWLKAQSGVVHTGTAVIGGTFDATAVTSTSVTAVINFSGYTSCPGIVIDRNRVINAPKHGIFVGGESVYTLDKKWVTRNSIEEHGVAGVGFGIYADFSANVEISSNYVYTAGVDDSIELGHSGPRWLAGGIDAHLTCDRNVVVGGQLQFPFSDYARITNNIVINNGIQNDANTANYVTITGNTVLNSSPTSGYAGINVAGDYFTVAHNRVQIVANGGGIHSASTTGSRISDNDIESLAAVGNTGAGVAVDAGANNVIRGNTVRGANAATSAGNGGFHYGVGVSATATLIDDNQLLATVGTSVFDNGIGNVYSNNNATAVFQGAPTLNGTGAIFRNNPGINTGAVTKTSAYTAKVYDFCILANATSAAFTVTLPTAAGYAGQAFIIKKTDSSAHAVTVATTSSQTIDGATTQSLTAQWQALYVVSDGSNWQTATASSTSLSTLTTLGDMLYEGTGPALARLAGNTTATKNFLTQTGTGSVSAAPAWGTLAAGDLPAPDIQFFTSSGTWTRPAGCTTTDVMVLGGGGGGGSGRRGAAGTVRCGGGGGAGAMLTFRTFATADLGSTVAVTVGTAGTGGAAVTADDTNGSSGGSGTNSAFGGFAYAPGAAGGSGGSNASGPGGTASTGGVVGGSGASASTTGGAGVQAAAAPAAPGGGSGGGITSADVAGNGGGALFSYNGSFVNTASGGVVDTTNPTAGTQPTAKGTPSCGAGGGAASKTTAAQSGATAFYGAGGGGGGASLDGSNSGAGGNGGPGFVLVISR